ncbi:hypothetical protein JTB14_015021 [Gonioctena quinquepunctata]|nr:hypothetical protein JTB14_015021 [Gonioctena quinquepunctata]
MSEKEPRMKDTNLIANYLIRNEKKAQDKVKDKFFVFQETGVTIPEPAISIWDFMNEAELTQFLKLSKRSEIKQQIDSKLDQEFPKGKPRALYIELMYNVTMFCKNMGLGLQKSAAVLSQFHMTHIFFTSNFNMSAEKVYSYFKELSLCHSLPFANQGTKIFSHNEMKIILELFCKLYLRYLPLIRLLSLPNFAFHLNYNLETEQVSNELVIPKTTSLFEGRLKEKGKKDKIKMQEPKSSRKGKAR